MNGLLIAFYNSHVTLAHSLNTVSKSALVVGYLFNKMIICQWFVMPIYKSCYFIFKITIAWVIDCLWCTFFIIPFGDKSSQI